MKNTKNIAYVIITLLSCTIASQQFAMDRYGNIGKHKTQEQRDAYNAAQEKQRQRAAEQKIRELKEKEEQIQRQYEAEERAFTLEQRQKAIDIDGDFFTVGMDDEVVRFQIKHKQSTTPTSQLSTEMSPLPFSYTEANSIAISKNNGGRTSSSTVVRTSSPSFSFIPIDKKRREESPIALAANGGKSSFTPAETLLTQLIMARKSLKKTPCSSNFMDIEQ